MKENETLTKKRAKEILKEFKMEIETKLKNKFVELVLFGSYARGDYKFGSDIDILIIIKTPLSRKEKDILSDIKTELSLKYNTVISAFEYLENAYKSWETPFLMNVRQEGMKI